jgi:transcriptional regulator with XRE-family HTH domain
MNVNGNQDDPTDLSAADRLRAMWERRRKMFDPEALISARKEAGLSQQRLAKRIGRGLGVVVYWEEGRHVPNSSSLYRLAGALGIGVTDLLRDESSHPQAGYDYEPLKEIRIWHFNGDAEFIVGDENGDSIMDADQIGEMLHELAAEMRNSA